MIRSRFHVGWVAFALILILLAGSSSSGQTTDTDLGYGTVTVPGDPEPVSRLTKGEGTSLCYHDLDDSGDTSPGDPVYLAFDTPDCAFDPGEVTAQWVRLTVFVETPGSRVRTSDADHGLEVSRLFQVDSFDQDLIWHYDADDNGAFNGRDHVYLSKDSRVDPGDIRLTATGSHEAGAPVEVGHPDLNRELMAWTTARVGEAAHYLDVDPREGFGTDDVPYLTGANRDPGDPPVVHVNALRLGSYSAEHGFGEVVRVDDADVVALLRDDFTGDGTRHEASICAVSRDGSLNYLPGDPVYFVPGSTDCRGEGTVQVHDLRLSGDRAGKQVRIGDDDHHHGPLIQLDGTGPAGTAVLAYHDTSPFGSFNRADTLYLITETGRDQVRVGDIRLTPFGDHEAGTVVEATHRDLNLPIAPFGPETLVDHLALFAYHDLDGNGAFDWDDVLTIRSDPEEDRVLHNFIRLGRTSALWGFGSVTRAGEPGVSTLLRPLRTSEAGAAFCAIEENDNGRYDPGEPVILRREGNCDERSSFSDLRLSSNDHGPVGTLLRSGDGDWNRVLAPFGDEVCLDHTANTTALMDPGAVLYLTVCTEIAYAGAIRLTAHPDHPAGTVVLGGHEDHGQALADGEPILQSERTWNLENVLYYHDTHGVGQLTTGGLVYLALHHRPDAVAPPESGVQVHNVRLTPVDHLVPPPSVPGPVENLSAVPGDARVTLQWEPPAGPAPVQEYQVEWGTRSGQYDASMKAVGPPATVDGLENEVPHFFIVRPVNELGLGNASQEVEVTPMSGLTGGPPMAPQDLRVEALDPDRVEVVWQPPPMGHDVSGYRIRSGEAPGGPYPQEWSAREPSLVIDGLEARSYTFIVVAVNTHGESPPSEEVVVSLASEEQDTPSVSLVVVLVTVGIALFPASRRARPPFPPTH